MKKSLRLVGAATSPVTNQLRHNCYGTILSVSFGVSVVGYSVWDDDPTAALVVSGAAVGLSVVGLLARRGGRAIRRRFEEIVLEIVGRR